jgi:hypothetical protein
MRQAFFRAALNHRLLGLTYGEYSNYCFVPVGHVILSYTDDTTVVVSSGTTDIVYQRVFEFKYNGPAGIFYPGELLATTSNNTDRPDFQGVLDQDGCSIDTSGHIDRSISELEAYTLGLAQYIAPPLP